MMLLFLLLVLAPSHQNELNIISIPNGDVASAPCAFTCAGVSNGRWIDSDYFSRAYTSIDIKDCGFISTPIITTSIRAFRTFPGQGYVRDPDKEIFQVYSEEYVTGEFANKNSWSVHWIAVGFQCDW